MWTDLTHLGSADHRGGTSRPLGPCTALPERLERRGNAMLLIAASCFPATRRARPRACAGHEQCHACRVRSDLARAWHEIPRSPGRRGWDDGSRRQRPATCESARRSASPEHWPPRVARRDGVSPHAAFVLREPRRGASPNRFPTATICPYSWYQSIGWALLVVAGARANTKECCRC